MLSPSAQPADIRSISKKPFKKQHMYSNNPDRTFRRCFIHICIHSMCSLHFCKSTTLRRCKPKFKVPHTNIFQAIQVFYILILWRRRHDLVRFLADELCVHVPKGVWFSVALRRARRKSWGYVWGHSLSVRWMREVEVGSGERLCPVRLWPCRRRGCGGCCWLMVYAGTWHRVLCPYAFSTLTLQNCATRIAVHRKTRMKWNLIKLQRWNITTISLADVQRSQIQ